VKNLQRRMDYGVKAVVFVGVVMMLTGCATQQAWKYSAEPQATGPAIVNKTVSVPPFADRRENKNENSAAMYMIPLMPFGWQDLQTPEGLPMHMTSAQWLWRPNEDIAKATAEEVQASGIFKEAFFTARPSEGQLVLQGTINSTRYKSSIYSYLLSVEGPLLWLIGFPATHVINELDLSFALKEGVTGKVLWEKSYKRNHDKVSWIYAMQSDFPYSELLKSIMMEATADMRTAMKALPPETAPVSAPAPAPAQ
jgi:hypothetical protein